MKIFGLIFISFWVLFFFYVIFSSIGAPRPERHRRPL